MIRGVGIDIVAIARIQSLWAKHGHRFLQRVFTDGEIAYCTARTFAAQHLAGRFAAKEAAAKALGTGLMAGIGFKDIEVVKHAGPPRIILHSKAQEMAESLGAAQIHLSISHDRGCAVALVIMEAAT